MKKPNCIIAGDTKVEVNEDEYKEFPDLLIIQCHDREQIRQAIRTGKIEFTIFGGEPEAV